jgi:hypothetical protein
MKAPLLLATCALFLSPTLSEAQAPLPPCTQITGASFSGTGSVRKLKADCQTSVTIVVPANTTLNGNGNTIVAVDPPAGNFQGAVIRNATPGSTGVVVTNLTVDTENLAESCKSGDNRLRGIMFDDASGKITNNKVLHINMGPSGCQEGNAIEVRDFSLAGINTVTVTGNRVYDYQKTGIVINGEVNASVSGNIIGESATQANLAANGIQIGFGAVANVSGNHIEGNTWLGFDEDTSNFSSSAILLYESAAATKVDSNLINLVGGNADVGIYIGADSVTVTANRVYDWGPDVAGADTEMDIGIANEGFVSNPNPLSNTITKNRVRCYQQAYLNVSGPSNVIMECNDPTSTAAPAIAAAASAAVARPASPFQQ